MDIVIPKLFDWQKDVWEFFDPRGKKLIIKSPRQTGKSFTICMLLLRTAGQLARSVSIVIEPTLNQTRRVFNDILEMLEGSGLIQKSNESLLTIKFHNGSTIHFKSAEQGKGILGFTVTGILILDECAYLPDKFIEDCLPVVRFHNATIVAASTPFFQSGWFYKQFIRPDDEDKRSFDWSKYDLSEVLTPEQVEEYRHTYSKNKFTTDILGEFLINDGETFTNIEACTVNESVAEGNLYFGIDWGSGLGKDYTAISCIDDSGNMKFIKYFNDKTPNDQIDTIVDLIKEYRPIKVTVESNSIGEIYYKLLMDKVGKVKYETSKMLAPTGPRVIRFSTSNKSKNRIIDKLNNALEEKKITILRDNELLTELRAYQQQVTKSGQITYNAMNGFNDDLIIATAICYDSIFSSRGTYSIGII